MGAFLDRLDSAGENPQEIAKAFQDYRNFLLSIRERIPASAYEFAAAPWHYDHEDHRCPHDSWVESVQIREPSSGTRREKRDLEIDVRLFVAFHDGYLELFYHRVHSYSFSVKKPGKGQIWHGDWLVDEVAISANGFVLHEVIFSSDSRWTIEAEDIRHRWTPID